MKNDDIELLTPVEAAKILKLNPLTLFRKRKEGKPPRFYKVGSRIMYKKQDIIDFIEKGAVDPTE